MAPMMMRSRCARCQHVFDLIRIPVPVDVLARFKKGATCPMCYNREGNFVAPSRDLTEAEKAAVAVHAP